MADDNQPEKESRGERIEEAAEARPDFEVELEEKKEAEKPTIPDVKKPEIPQEENIPAGGPGGQNQSQPAAAQPQTQEEKIKKIKDELKKPIRTGTPKERKDSSDLEDKHNQDVLET